MLLLRQPRRRAMKYLRLSSIVVIIAICSIATWFFTVRSSETVSYKGAGGWTLELSMTKLVLGQEPVLVGKNIKYFHPDGRRRDIEVSLRNYLKTKSTY